MSERELAAQDFIERLHAMHEPYEIVDFEAVFLLMYECLLRALSE